MKIIPRQLVACTGVLALSAVGLFAAVNGTQNNRNRKSRQDRFLTQIETVLAMTPSQQDQARMTFDQARQTAQPIRQELKTTTRQLHAAVRSDDTAQVKQLSTTEGQEIGQLLAIRSQAVAKIYKSLTADQQTRAQALQNLMMRSLRYEMGAHSSPSAS